MNWKEILFPFLTSSVEDCRSDRPSSLLDLVVLPECGVDERYQSLPHEACRRRNFFRFSGEGVDLTLHQPGKVFKSLKESMFAALLKDAGQ